MNDYFGNWVFWNFWGFGAFLFFPLLVSSFVFFPSFVSLLLQLVPGRERVGGGSFDICVAEEEEEERRRR
jgi:hypothetical protein